MPFPFGIVYYIIQVWQKDETLNFGTAIPPQPLNGFLQNKDQLCLEASSIIGMWQRKCRKQFELLT